MDSTSLTLLMRLKQAQPDAAWERFCRIYGPPIIRYCRKLGLAEADARDALQESLVTLMRLLPKFDYDPQRGRFRNYVLTIVHRQALAILRRAAKSPNATPADLALLADEAAPVSVEADDRWQEALLDQAWCQLRASGRIKPDTAAVFDAYAIQGLPCEIVCKKYGLAANTIYQIKNRVLAMLKSEVSLMMAELDPDEFEGRGKDRP